MAFIYNSKPLIVGSKPMIKRKHILFLVSGMQGGGAERVASTLSNYWVEKGHRVTLIPTFSGRGDCVYHLDERVELDFLADRVSNTKKSIWNRLHRFWVLRKLIQQYNPSVIVSFLTHVNVAAILCSFGSKIPVIVSERTYPPRYPLGFFLRTLRVLLYPYATAVVMQTNQGLAWLKDRVSQNNGVVIPNPVTYPMVRSSPVIMPKDVISGDRKICLSVGRLVKEKGFSELISAFGGLASKFPNWDLVILGSGYRLEKLEQRVSSLGLQDRVYFPGQVGNVSDWYLCAGAYVMNSRFEGFPNTLLEAMAHGMPVISADCDTGPKEIITDGIDGLLVDTLGVRSELSSAMEKIFQDPIFSRSLGQEATEVRKRFSLDSIGSKWDDLIELHTSWSNGDK